MCRLIDDILVFLKASGFECTVQMRSGLDVIYTKTLGGGHERVLLPLEITALSAEEAQEQSRIVAAAIENLPERPIIITEDRWHAQQDMMKARVLAHLEVFDQVYARNCEIRRIDKITAADFLAANHSYGDSSNRYRYGLFLKRHTGHIASEGSETWKYPPGTLVAVATFSNARKWVKGEQTISSYEWIRYASLPGLRISGGMGKLLKTFIEEVQPDDIMSYADLEWSEGTVYEQLGFTLEGQKDPVLFGVDSEWNRSPVKPGMKEGGKTGVTDPNVIAGQPGNMFYMNFGSNKYRLKLTEYE